MSWDVCVMRFSRPYASLQDMTPDERALALGDAVLVREAVAHAFPGTNWSDPAWGRWEGPWGSIEFNLGKEEPATSMMLHVRAGPEVVPGIVSLCVDNGWQAVDCSDGQFLEKKEDPARGLEAWRAFRDRVLGGETPDGSTTTPSG